MKENFFITILKSIIFIGAAFCFGFSIPYVATEIFGYRAGIIYSIIFIVALAILVGYNIFKKEDRDEDKNEN